MIKHDSGIPIHQIWHPHETFFNNFKITAIDEFNQPILPTVTKTYYSPTYGNKVSSDQITFTTKSNKNKMYELLIAMLTLLCNGNPRRPVTFVH